MTKINLLLAEDNDTDALLLIRQLRKEGFEVDHVQVKTRDEMNKALDRGGWDIVISDFSMPGFGGGDALELFKSKGLDIPFILVSGTVGEDIAVSIMKGGANDYLMKTHLHRLGPAVKRELEETAMKRDKKRVETVLTQTEKRFQRLIRDLLDVVWLANLEGTRTYIINAAFTKIYDIELDDVRAQPSRWIESVIAEDVSGYTNFITELNPHGISTHEYRIRRSDGSERWVKDQRYIISGDSGGESMVGGILSDITEKKLAEQELIQAKMAAEESSRMKSALLQNMSHEFRTPMNGILGFSEILAGELSDPHSKTMSEHIFLSGKRLQQTLDSIMLFAQLESGIPLKPVTVDIRDIIGSICECLDAMINSKGLALEVAIEPSLLVVTDEHLLRRSLFNIIENAVKFTSTGSISITGKYTANGELDIRIRDTGIGIAPEKQEIIFEEFRQAEEGYNRPYEGSGLGLAIVRKAIRTLNGKISLKSEAGKGAEFVIILPSGSTKQASNTTDKPDLIIPEETNDPLREPPLILLVEDNEANIDLVKHYLLKNYRLEVARDGESSLEMVKTKKYKAILMDINLGPGIDGIYVIGKIREMQDYRLTPIIAVTGYAFRNEKDYIISKGANHYLEKPFYKQVLIDLLDNVVM